MQLCCEGVSRSKDIKGILKVSITSKQLKGYGGDTCGAIGEFLTWDFAIGSPSNALNHESPQFLELVGSELKGWVPSSSGRYNTAADSI